MSDLAEWLYRLCEAEGLPLPQREYRFHPTRRWRFDLAWPERKIAVECDGGVFTRGRHTRGPGFSMDCEKLNAAALLGWRTFRFTTRMISAGTAMETLKQALTQ